MSDREFAALTRAAVESRLGCAVAETADRIAEAWRSSRTAIVASAVSSAIGPWPAADRLRLGSMVIGWAAAAHWGALAIIPAYVATGIPHACFLGAGLLSFAVAATASRLVLGWRDSAMNRLVQRLIT